MKQSGFFLIEAMVALGVGAILVTSILTYCVWLNTEHQRAMRMLELCHASTFPIDYYQKHNNTFYISKKEVMKKGKGCIIETVIFADKQYPDIAIERIWVRLV